MRAGGPDLYFSESPRELELAKQLCRPCPLRTRCLEGAKDRGSLGAWGGPSTADPSVRVPGDVLGTSCPRSQPSSRPPRPRPADWRVRR